MQGTTSVHGEDPCKDLYFPGLQATHSPPCGPEKPTLQVQFNTSMLALGDDEKFEHCEQTPTPVEFLKEFLGQASQILPSAFPW